MSEKMFWYQQDKLKDKRENKLLLKFISGLTTILPVSLIYGRFYESLLRKIPFSLQIMGVSMIYLINLNLIVQIRSIQRRVEKYTQENKKIQIEDDLNRND
jgi:hypothetical protein